MQWNHVVLLFFDMPASCPMLGKRLEALLHRTPANFILTALFAVLLLVAGADLVLEKNTVG